VNSTDVTSSVSNNQYTVSNIKTNTTVEVEFEAIPVIINTYTLSVKATGNGSATYNGTTAKNDTKTFTLNEGTSATITFAPDNGYRIMSVKVNNTDVTSSVVNNNYTVSSIKTNTTVEVEFEAIPPTTYTLSITASGNGSATYNETTIANNTQSFTLIEGTNATITFNPNNGYQVKSVKENGIDVTSNVSNNQYTVSNISTNTTIEVEFEVIPPTTYTLSITASGNGSATYNETTIVNNTESFTLIEGTNVTISFSPDNGYQIKSVKVNSTDVTSSVSNNQYTINNINANTTVEVEFEAIPVETYILEYVVDGETYKTYEIDEGAAITPEAEPTKEGYSFSGWSEIPATMPDHDVTVTGSFTKMESEMTADGINYEVVSFGNHTVVVAAGVYGQTLEVPETIEYGNNTWTVMGLKDGALDECESLAAVIWNPSIGFNARVNNPNLLLYVKDKAYASLGVNNVVVNGTAENIELRDALSGNDFYCPRTFKAKKISYSHRYNMETGLGDSRGWETIVLPFDVQKCTSPKGEIVPFVKWANSDRTKPFWLLELTASGYKDVEGIKANTPYIISMPNNPQYLADYVIVGIVTFSAENVEVKASDEMQSAQYQDRTFVPNYTNKDGDEYLALNVNNYYVTNPGTDVDGSKFIKGLRDVHPFEAYMTTTSNTRSIDVMDAMTTAIRDIIIAREGTDDIKVYDTRGVLVKTAIANDHLRKGLAAGVYIVNGKKMIIK
jgi:carbon monoxide dehydrogenase subunit G